MQIDEYTRGISDGLKVAVTALHQRAKELNDQSATDALNVLANQLGRLAKEQRILSKWEALCRLGFK